MSCMRCGGLREIQKRSGQWVECPVCNGKREPFEESKNGYDDIILRFCPGYGWLGLFVTDMGDELYRTGIHHKTREMALQRVDEWIKKNPDKVIEQHIADIQKIEKKKLK